MLKASVISFMTLCIIWLVLTGGSLQEIWFGLLLVSIATVSAVIVWSSVRLTLNPFHILPFLGFMLKESVLGGLDVARRALSPKVAIESGYITYSCRPHANEMVLVFLVWLVSIPPGTISVSLQKNQLTVHVLNTHNDNTKKIKRLEEHLHSLFR